MFIACLIVSALLGAALLASARAKLVQDERVMTTMRGVGVRDDKVWLLAVAEIAGAIGLVGGLWWWPLGVAAAVGVILYFVGAVSAHLRQYDLKIASPAIVLVWGVAALTLRLLSH